MSLPLPHPEGRLVDKILRGREMMTAMLNITEAAEKLNCSTKGLRRLVDRSRRRAKGDGVSGPTIKFFQARRSSQILFREEWLNDYVESCTVDPDFVPEHDLAETPRPSSPPVNNVSLPDFDSNLFQV